MTQKELERQAKKEISRIKRQLKRMEARGYRTTSPVIIPREITPETIVDLQRLDASELYNRSYYIDAETGEVLSSQEGRAIERSRASVKAAQTKAAGRKPLTATEVEYNKELKRVKQFIRRLNKRGYDTSSIKIPAKPKKVTKKNVKQLKEINPKNIYGKITYKDPTGKKVSGEEGRKIERSKAAKKAKATKKQAQSYPTATDIILTNILDMIRQWDPSPNWSKWFSQQKERDKGILERMLEGAIASEGRDAVARRLEAHATEVIQLANEILYGSGGDDYKDGGVGRSRINFDLTRFSAIIMGRALTQRESMDLTELSETNEFEG